MAMRVTIARPIGVVRSMFSVADAVATPTVDHSFSRTKVSSTDRASRSSRHTMTTSMAFAWQCSRSFVSSGRSRRACEAETSMSG
jgi:hypothetical protein